MNFNKPMTNPRREFDPSNKEDQLELAYFMKNSHWRDTCPFYLEYPYADIPTMCLVKYTKYSLEV